MGANAAWPEESHADTAFFLPLANLACFPNAQYKGYLDCQCITKSANWYLL